MPSPVTYTRSGPVSHIVMDDGKANVMSLAMLNSLHAAFDEAEHGVTDIMVTAVEQVIPRGRRSYDVKFTLKLTEASGSPRTPAGRCSVEDGEVASYSRF